MANRLPRVNQVGGEILEHRSSIDDNHKDEDEVKGYKNNLQVKHRMHRSAVRPFFCCGSEISLVSLAEDIDKESSLLTEETDKSIEVISEDDSQDNLLPKVKTISKCQDCNSACSGCRRPTTSQRRKKGDKMTSNLSKSKKKFWSLKSRGKFPHAGRYSSHHGQSPDSTVEKPRCVCTSYKSESANQQEQDLLQSASNQILLHGRRIMWNTPLSLVANFDELYPTDVDERRRAARAREIQDSIVATNGAQSSNVSSSSNSQAQSGATSPTNLLCQMFENRCTLTLTPYPLNSLSLSRGYGVNNSDYEESHYGELDFSTPLFSQVVHTQVDYMHCLVPELSRITNCSFYWGVMDRYEAEKLLENKPEGTFLLRDSAQDEFLFSVSFRRYNRSLHARIEQWNHKFSFDAHDPAVFATETVCRLIEHYKDPNCCMFFEPMLTLPLTRNFSFSLQHLCRSTISDNIAYDDISSLPLPKALKEYITYYHYKHKLRVRRLDMPN